MIIYNIRESFEKAVFELVESGREKLIVLAAHNALALFEQEAVGSACEMSGTLRVDAEALEVGTEEALGVSVEELLGTLVNFRHPDLAPVPGRAIFLGRIQMCIILALDLGVKLFHKTCSSTKLRHICNSAPTRWSLSLGKLLNITQMKQSTLK